LVFGHALGMLSGKTISVKLSGLFEPPCFIGRVCCIFWR
jgi:hypothetical protein